MNYTRKLLILVIIGLCGPLTSYAQKEKKNKGRAFVVAPAPFRYPETRFGVVVAALYTFRFDTKDTISRPSQIQVGGGYTQNKQVLSYVNSLLVTPGRKYLINTECGYYDYFYPFGGIGFSQPADYNENYFVKFPRIRATVLKRFGENIYVGPRFYYDQYKITKVEPNGLLDGGTITGSKGGSLVQYGLVSTFDTRDNIFSAYSGSFVEFGVTGASEAIAGNYNFTRVSMSASKYQPLRKNLTLVVNGTGDFYFGDPPFNGTAYLGGPRVLRGFYEGRYRNRKAISTQAELRWRVLPWLGFVGFVSTGTVANDIDGFRADQLLFSAGPGVRFTISQKDRLNLRIDYGQTNKGYGNLYVTFFEAF